MSKIHIDFRWEVIDENRSSSSGIDIDFNVPHRKDVQVDDNYDVFADVRKLLSEAASDIVKKLNGKEVNTI